MKSLSISLCLGLFFICNTYITAQISSAKDSTTSFIDYKISQSFKARNSGKIDSAFIYINDALSSAKKMEHSSQVIMSHLNRGAIYRQIGKLDSCKLDYTEAAKIAQEVNDTNLLSSAYNGLGNIEHVQNNFEGAIELYMQYLSLKTAKGDKRGIAIAHHNIAQIQLDMQDNDKAYEGFLKSYEITKSIKNKRKIHHNLLIKNLVKMGNSKRNDNLFEEALEEHKEARLLALEYGDLRAVLDTEYAMALDYVALEKFENAYNFLNKSIVNTKKLQHKAYESAVLSTLARLYITMNDSLGIKKIRFPNKEIEDNLLRSELLSIESENEESRIEALETLVLFYSNTKNYVQLSKYQEKLLEANSTIYDKERQSSVAKWEAKYKTAEQEKEIVLLESTNKLVELKSKYLFWTLVGITFIFTFMSIFGYKYIKNKSEKKRLLEAREFRSNISSDLHDEVGSILTALTMQSEVLKEELIESHLDRTTKISDLSRRALSRMRDMVWSIDSRRDNTADLSLKMREYLKELLEKRKLQFEFKNNTNQPFPLRPEVRQNIFLIFKESVVNAAKHSNGNLLTVTMSQSKKLFSLNIADNGNLASDNNSSSGSGILNINNRAKKINGELKISRSNGYEIQLKVPLT